MSSDPIRFRCLVPPLNEAWCDYGGGHTFMSRARVRKGKKRCCEDPEHKAEQKADWVAKAKLRSERVHPI